MSYDSNEEILDLFQDEDQDFQRRQIVRQRLEQSKLRILETLYKDRGLRFSPGGWGCVPTQIYGEIDGKRFYWRTRGNTSSIKIGPVNKALDDKLHQGEVERQEVKLAEHKATCTEDLCFNCLLLENPPATFLQDDERYYPMQVTETAFLYPVGAVGDDYKGDLELDEVIPTFIYLMNNLEEIPHAKQISVLHLCLLEKDGLSLFDRVGELSSDLNEQTYLETEQKRLTKKWQHLYQ